MSVKTVSRSALALAASAALAGGAFMLGSAPANAASNPAPSSAAQAAKTSSISTKWTWANGSKVTASELKATALKASEYYLRVDHSQGNIASPSLTLPNGHGVGITNGGKVVELTKTGPKNYFTGALPKNLTDLQVRSSSAFAISKAGDIYRFDGPSKKATKVVSLGSFAEFSLSGSRVYWTDWGHKVSGGKFEYRVLSRSLSGGAVKVEAVNARSPQVTDAGVLVVRTGGAWANEDYDAQGVVKGIGVLKGGKVAPLLNTSAGTIPATIGDGLWYFGASGHTLTLPAAGTSGQIVINLKTKRAWHVSVAKNNVPTWGGEGGNLSAWTVVDPGGNRSDNTVYIADVDKGTLRSLHSTVGPLSPSVSGKAISWTSQRSTTNTQFTSIVLK